MSIKKDYNAGQSLNHDDWNQVATIIETVRVVKAVATLSLALALATGTQFLEIIVTADPDNSKNGKWNYDLLPNTLTQVKPGQDRITAKNPNHLSIADMNTIGAVMPDGETTVVNQEGYITALLPKFSKNGPFIIILNDAGEFEIISNT